MSMAVRDLDLAGSTLLPAAEAALPCKPVEAPETRKAPKGLPYVSKILEPVGGLEPPTY
jgi:hypothetical protein